MHSCCSSSSMEGAVQWSNTHPHRSEPSWGCCEQQSRAPGNAVAWRLQQQQQQWYGGMACACSSRAMVKDTATQISTILGVLYCGGGSSTAKVIPKRI